MNSHYVNINVVGKLLFVGVKGEATLNEIEQKLHNNMFMEEHYQRIHKKKVHKKIIKKNIFIFFFLLVSLFLSRLLSSN